MHRLWETVVEPVLEAARPAVIVEIGTAGGEQAERLLEFAHRTDAVVHVIDPAPGFDLEQWQRRHGDRLRVHTARSLDVLAELSGADAVLIDGDHNWYTVINELRLLEAKATEEGREPPLVLAHDVGWPYGRRDLYYDSDSVPAEHRQPHERLGLMPGTSRPVTSGGLNRHLDNAIYEGTPRNGVLTAIEDFIEESSLYYELALVGGMHGIGILPPASMLERTPQLAKQLAAFGRAPFLRRQGELLECARVELAAAVEEKNAQLAARNERISGLERELDARAQETSDLERVEGLLEQERSAVNKLGAESERLGRQAAELRQAHGDLQEQLEHARAARARAEARADLGAERERELAGRLEALRAEMTSGRGLDPRLDPDDAGDGGDFADRYRSVAAELGPGGENAPVGNVLTLDRFGTLLAAGDPGRSGTSVDVVVCVHDAPDDVLRCLRSLLAVGGYPFHLVLVDDGSELPTRRLLEWFAGEHSAVELIPNADPPHGYTIAANVGLRASRGDLVVLLNSDAIVTPGWLDALVELSESEPGIGVLGPLSNAATHQSVPAVKDASGWALNPLPDWLTPDAMGYLVGKLSDRARPRVPFVNGFCFALRRELIERVGEFDEELFGAGFCEENDYAVRADDAGFTLAVADTAYVHHAKSRSYGSELRERIAREHYNHFLEKHGEGKVDALLARFEEVDEALAPLRARLAEATASPDALEGAVAGLRESPMEVAFVLPGLSAGGGGGAHSVYQEAVALNRLGARAKVMIASKHLDRAAELYHDADRVFVPYSSERELSEATSEAEVIVATHNSSIRDLAALRTERNDFLPAYYVQDYEPFFAPAGSKASDQALLSYGTVPGLLAFAKTDWLASVLAIEHGIQVAKVEPSIDTDIYHPRGRAEHDPGRPLRLAAMVRPRTPRRQPLATLRLLERACEELGAEAVSFGCSDDELASLAGGPPRGVEHRGLLRREQVAGLLRETDLFVDLSTYQAFGRTGLEAMACGATALLPAIGGVREYAQDGVNGLLVETDDPAGCLAAVGSLACDRVRLERMQAAATTAAARYSSLRAALSEYVLFESELSRGHTRVGALP